MSHLVLIAPRISHSPYLSSQQQAPTGNNYAPNAGAPGAGAGIGPGATDPAVPPASHINRDNNRSGSGGSRLAGKAERGLGTLVGSQALKERGLQKEQEASAFKMQSAEIAEAERLEKEALMRRERAVAHGELWSARRDEERGEELINIALCRCTSGQQAPRRVAECE